jgi:protein HIRA/HIR1
MWENLVTAKLNIVGGNSFLVCAASEDHCIHLFSTSTGRRLCPALVVTSSVSELLCTGNFVMAVTSIADLTVWNVRTMTCLVKNVSLDYLLSGADVTLDHCRLTEQGIPIVSLSNGRSFSYHVDLSCWLLLTSRDDVLYQCSDHQTSVMGSIRPNGLLAQLHASVQRRASLQGAHLFHSDASLQRVSSICHLENQLACSTAIRSPKEYHFWLLAYVRYLIQEALESKLREVCNELLGPVHGSLQLSSSRWDPMILGYRKHSLLREILPIIGANLGLQRLFTEYQQQLVEVDSACL